MGAPPVRHRATAPRHGTASRHRVMVPRHGIAMAPRHGTSSRHRVTAPRHGIAPRTWEEISVWVATSFMASKTSAAIMRVSPTREPSTAPIEVKDVPAQMVRTAPTRGRVGLLTCGGTGNE